MITCKRSVLWVLFVCFWLTPFSCGFCSPFSEFQVENDRKSPNILFLFADDQRVDTIGAYGNDRIKTPTIDQLAHNGMNFRNAYCFGSPHGAVCQPSRAMLHTGRSLYHIPNLNMQGVKTLGEILGENGYQTFGTGKWHNGQESFARSFQLGKGIMFGGMSDHSKVPIVDMNADQSFSQQRMGESFSSQLFADAAIEFLANRDQDKPFFCYVSFTAPHDPRMSPAPFDRMYSPDDMQLPKNFMPQHPFDNGQLTTRDEKLGAWPRTEKLIRHQTAEYYGLISHLDHQVSRILDQLKTNGDLENTIVVYAADHGLGIGSHGLLGKQSLYEHSMKAPLIINGPGIQHGSTEALVYLHDLFPTLLTYARVELPNRVDGLELQPLVEGSKKTIRKSLFLTYGKLMRAVRDERWKLIYYPQINRRQLFDLKNDPSELIDLSKDINHVEQTARMTGMLEAWQSFSSDNQPLQVENPRNSKVDLSGRERKPDRWQPKWIVDKYFDNASDDEK